MTGLKANEAVWDTLPYAQDQHYHKRSVIFSQLCGFAQRLASEPVKQDIRQGTWYLTEENERRTRQSRFNAPSANYSVVKNVLVDVSVSARVSGVGYKFGGLIWAAIGGRGGWAGESVRRCFKTYVEQKQQACRTYYAASAIVSQLSNLMKSFCNKKYPPFGI